MNKQALIVGGGSKFGLQFLNSLLDKDWHVNLISGSSIVEHPKCNQIQVDWKNLKITDIEKFLNNLPVQSLIFFNQNSSALGSDNCYKVDSYTKLNLWKQEKDWNQAYFVSCILPFHIIHTLAERCTPETKIGWMLSSLILAHKSTHIQYSDYIGNKYFNYIMIKNFSVHHHSSFFGINPDSLDETGTNENLDKLIKFVSESNRETINNKVFKMTADEDLNFRKFFYE